MENAARLAARIKRAKMVVYLFPLAVVAFFLLFAGFQADYLARSVIFHPPKYPLGEWKPEGVDFEEVIFTSPSGAKSFLSFSSSSSAARDLNLVGWYFPYKNGEPDAVILYSHGNASNITSFPRFAEMLRRRFRASVLVYDYRGYGKSEGSPSVKGILRDGRAAAEWLAAQEGIATADIVQWGQSLGGGVAIDLAAELGARALIVESSFTSLPDMAKSKISSLLPAKTLLREELPGILSIAKFKGPVFVSHGKADAVIPFEQGERLFKAANEPKTFFIPPSGDDYHSAPLTEEHLEKLDVFFGGLK